MIYQVMRKKLHTVKLMQDNELQKGRLVWKTKKKKNITKWTEPRNIIAARVSWNQHQPRDHDSYPRINTWLTWNPHQELEENSQPKFH